MAEYFTFKQFLGINFYSRMGNLGPGREIPEEKLPEAIDFFKREVENRNSEYVFLDFFQVEKEVQSRTSDLAPQIENPAQSKILTSDNRGRDSVLENQKYPDWRVLSSSWVSFAFI